MDYHLITWDLINPVGDLLADFDAEQPFEPTPQEMAEFLAVEKQALDHAIAVDAWAVRMWHDGCCEAEDFYIHHEFLVELALDVAASRS